ncbi:fatty acid desaturase [Opitutales bacterium]|nr:fatty acid desaturase [Opitutales bacterium]
MKIHLKQHSDESFAWKTAVAPFQKPHLPHSSWQIANSVGSYVLLWFAMYLSVSLSVWLTLGLAVLAAGFQVRIFILFHDCAHGSFFASKRANDVLGFITGVLTFTPYLHWRWEHCRHHATSGNLNKRGMGDIKTMTVQEYLEATRFKRTGYRMLRNPVILLLIVPVLLFLIKQRFPSAEAGKRERRSVHWTNLGILLMVAGLCWVFGIQMYVLIQLAITVVSGGAGIWLFYVQHQFEGVSWERDEKWDYTTAALDGSSFYRLPKLLQWFSGNIGFHHIHHLSPRIPNYNLEACHRASPCFHQVHQLTLWSSLRSLNLRLWDEKERRLVSFRHLRTLQSPRPG